MSGDSMRRRRPPGASPWRPQGRRRARGFALPTAVFLLVVLAALGAFALRLSSAQHVGAAQDFLGARAYQAARSGIEWGTFRALQASACAAADFSPGGGLAEFTVSVTCGASSASEDGVTIRFYSLQATACNQPDTGQPAGAQCPNANPGAHYVERSLSATVSR